MKWLVAICIYILNSSLFAFEVTSHDMPAGGRLPESMVYNGFDCTGGNTSPHVEWRNPPKGTRSFAITLFDLDAPTGSGWWQWTVFNIPPHVTSLAQGAGSASHRHLLPAQAIEGRTDFGSSGFNGVCPPKGRKPHRFVLTVWALNIEKLALDENVTGAMLGFMLNAHSMGKAQIMARYGRSK